jgi:hypothetical protein
MSSFSSPILSATQYKNLAYRNARNPLGFASTSTSSSCYSKPSKQRQVKPDTDEGFLDGHHFGSSGSGTQTGSERSDVLESKVRYKAKALEEASSSFPLDVANSWIELDGYFSRCENGTRFSDVSEVSFHFM